MSLVVGQNSWCTVAEADTYLTDRINAEEWFNLNVVPANPGEVAKESLLVSAFYWLRGSSELEIPVNATDSNVKNAQIEASWFLYNYVVELEDRRAAIYTGLTEFKLSKRMEKLDINNIKVPDFITGMVPEYNVSNGVVQLKGEYDV